MAAFTSVPITGYMLLGYQLEGRRPRRLLLLATLRLPTATASPTPTARPAVTPRPRPTPVPRPGVERVAESLKIVDQNGRPAVEGVPSATSVIHDVTVGQGFQFVPSSLTIVAGDTVRWTWVSSGHSVTSGTPCITDRQFCSPDNTNCNAGVLSNTGSVYEHTFGQSGTYSYFCFAHCEYGMSGVVNVLPFEPPRPTRQAAPESGAAAHAII